MQLFFFFHSLASSVTRNLRLFPRKINFELKLKELMKSSVYISDILNASFSMWAHEKRYCSVQERGGEEITGPIYGYTSVYRCTRGASEWRHNTPVVGLSSQIITAAATVKVLFDMPSGIFSLLLDVVLIKYQHPLTSICHLKLHQVCWKYFTVH